MPPKPQVTAEAVYAAAFALARTEGLECVSVRRIADALGCSTQPVYTACDSMAEIKEAVVARAAVVAEARLTGDGSDTSFLVVGLGALRFAHEEPHLFRMAGSYMASRAGTPPASVMVAMRKDPELGQLSGAALSRIHELLWVFSQGLAIMVQPGCPPDAMAHSRDLLERAGEAFIAHEVSGRSKRAPSTGKSAPKQTRSRK